MNQKQKEQIRELSRLRTQAYISVLAEMAQKIAEDGVNSSLRLCKNPKRLDNVRTPEEITTKVLQNYLEGLNKGGTTCVERIIRNNGDGTYTFTTEQRFVPWLNDMTQNTADAIISYIGEAESAGEYPLDTARKLKSVFEGTRHRAVTAARTEAQKIRTDARFETFADQGVKYVQYVTVGDGKVRPEHRARDGKIYRIEDAPYLGEYNCRCTVTPADYKVRLQGAPVEPSDAITLTEEQIAGDAPIESSNQDLKKVEVKVKERDSQKLWKAFTAQDMVEIKTLDQLKGEMETRWGLENITIDKTMERIDLQVIKDNVLAADKMITDLKLQNLICQMIKENNSTAFMACESNNGPAKLYWYDLMANKKTSAEAYARNVKSGFHPAGTTYADVMTHEMAHAVEWRICQLAYPSLSLSVDAWNKSKVATEIVTEAIKEYKKITNTKGLKKDILTVNISGYARKNDSEALAEAFAAYYANGEKANYLSKLIIIITKDKLKTTEGLV